MLLSRSMQRRLVRVSTATSTERAPLDRFGLRDAYQLSLTTCVSAQIDVPSPDQIDAAAATLKLLADPTRLRIVWALLHGSHAVGDLAEHIGAQPAAVSQHLAKLRLAQLVRSERDGNRILYVLENEHIRRLTTEALFQSQRIAGIGHPHGVPGHDHQARGQSA